MTDDPTPIAASDAEPEGTPATPAPDVDAAADAVVGSTPRARWTRRRHAIVWGSIAAGALVLGGITGAVIAAALPQSSAVAEPSDEPEPEPTPSEDRDDLEVVEPPRPVLDSGCSELIPEAVVASLLRGEQVLPREGVTDPPGSLTSAMYRQAGSSYCRWGGEYKTDGGYDTGVDLTVLPGGTSYYFERIRPEALIDINYTVVDSHGDASTYRCAIYASYWCGADMVVGDYWAHVDINASFATGTSEEEAHRVVERLLAEIEVGIRGTTSSAPWVGPTDPYDGGTLCSLTPEQASEIAGLPGLESTDDVHGYYASMETAVRERVEQRYCGWATPNYESTLSLGVLPGGAWSVSAMTKPQAFLDVEHVEVLGADDALVGCNSAWCSAYLAVDGSLVTVTLDPAGAAAFDALLVRLVAAL